MKRSPLVLIAPLMMLSACANMGAGYTPILDGPVTRAFQSDLTSCQTLARNQRQFDQETAAAAVLGGGLGAAFGEFDDDASVAEGLIAGALVGAVTGAVEASERREAIVIECLKGRGHPVVG